MTENNDYLNGSDEMLVQNFFAECTPDIADNGFTERVMRRLPSRSIRLNRIWTLICSLAGILLLLTQMPPVTLRNMKNCILYFGKNALEHVVDRLSTMDLSQQDLMTFGFIVLSFAVVGLCSLLDELRIRK